MELNCNIFLKKPKLKAQEQKLNSPYYSISAYNQIQKAIGKQIPEFLK